MQHFRTVTTASPDAVWPLLARPGRWHEWAPHLRGATGLGSPEVEAGRVGVAWVLGAPVLAQIVHKHPGRSWAWRVGPAVLVHAVRPRDEGGSTISVTIQAPLGLDAALGAAYGPVIRVVLGRLARRAEAS